MSKPSNEDVDYDKLIQLQWSELLSEIPMNDVPLEVINQVIIHFKNGKIKSVDISEIADSSLDYKKLESALQRQLQRLEDEIESVDWVINSKKIIDTVETAKTELFKNKK
tara:strand:+ start:292 stop:621 length:330 start_codon:yes stop_codon:yes gene_type:complete